MPCAYWLHAFAKTIQKISVSVNTVNSSAQMGIWCNIWGMLDTECLCEILFLFSLRLQFSDPLCQPYMKSKILMLCLFQQSFLLTTWERTSIWEATVVEHTSLKVKQGRSFGSFPELILRQKYQEQSEIRKNHYEVSSLLSVTFSSAAKWWVTMKWLGQKR